MGLTLMFVMPVLLAIVITAIQNSTFELVNNNKLPLILSNRDTGEASLQLTTAIEKIGMFEVQKIAATENDEQIKKRMNSKDALVAVVIPAGFSKEITEKAKNIAGRAIKDFGVGGDSAMATSNKCRTHHFILSSGIAAIVQAIYSGSITKCTADSRKQADSEKSVCCT